MQIIRSSFGLLDATCSNIISGVVETSGLSAMDLGDIMMRLVMKFYWRPPARASL